MVFFVMAAAIMAVCIISIHKIAIKMGGGISLSALVLCGISALIINFMAIQVNPFLTKAYYYILGSMIIFAASSITCYNKYLLYRNHNPAVHGVGGAELISDEDIGHTLSDAVAASSTAEEVSDENVVVEPAAQKTEAESKPESEIEQDAEAETELETKQEQEVEAEIEAEAEPEQETEAEIEAEAKPEQEVEAEIEAEAKPEQEAQVESESETELEQDVDVETEIEPVLPEGLDSMDSLLDFAFAQAAAGDHVLALLAYSTALERYRNDAYAPFIIIDMVNLYKSQGQYQAAVDCIRKAMDIPAIQANPAYQQNFQSYLAQIESLSHSADAQLTKD